MTTNSFALLGKRKLAYLDGGDSQGYPVIGLHGTPGCRYSRWPNDTVYERLGVRYITFDRAGYGESTRMPGRNVAETAEDVIILADHLGIEKFSLTGGSGGGPYALAAAALYPSRVERVSALSSIAPLGRFGLSLEEWIGGMDRSDALEMELAISDPQALEQELSRVQSEMERSVADDMPNLLGEAKNDSDKAFLSLKETQTAFRGIVKEQSKHGLGGWLDDDLAFARDWGFDIADVMQTVFLLWGLQDASLPPRHNEWLSQNLRFTHAIIDSVGGHLPRDPMAEIQTNMRWLIKGQIPTRAFLPS